MARSGTKGMSRAEREEQILGVALEEFGRHGHARVSVAEVARRADISKPLIYSYFGSRDGLASACVRRAGDLLVAGVAAATPTAGPATTGPATTDPGRRALDTLAAIVGVLEGCRYAWPVLYDPTVPRGSEASTLARGYRAELAAMGAQGTAEVLRRAGNADPLDHEVLGRVWQHAVSAVVTWWLDHPEVGADAMVARCARVLAALGLDAPTARARPSI